MFLADFSLLNSELNFMAIHRALQNQHRLAQPQNSSSRPLHSQRHGADGRMLPQKKQEATSTSGKNVSSEQQQKYILEKRK